MAYKKFLKGDGKIIKFWEVTKSEWERMSLNERNRLTNSFKIHERRKKTLKRKK